MDIKILQNYSPEAPGGEVIAANYNNFVDKYNDSKRRPGIYLGKYLNFQETIDWFENKNISADNINMFRNAVDIMELEIEKSYGANDSERSRELVIQYIKSIRNLDENMEMTISLDRVSHGINQDIYKDIDGRNQGLNILASFQKDITGIAEQLDNSDNIDLAKSSFEYSDEMKNQISTTDYENSIVDIEKHAAANLFLDNLCFCNQIANIITPLMMVDGESLSAVYTCTRNGLVPAILEFAYPERMITEARKLASAIRPINKKPSKKAKKKIRNTDSVNQTTRELRRQIANGIDHLCDVHEQSCQRWGDLFDLLSGQPVEEIPEPVTAESITKDNGELRISHSPIKETSPIKPAKSTPKNPKIRPQETVQRISPATREIIDRSETKSEARAKKRKDECKDFNDELLERGLRKHGLILHNGEIYPKVCPALPEMASRADELAKQREKAAAKVKKPPKVPPITHEQAEKMIKEAEDVNTDIFNGSKGDNPNPNRSGNGRRIPINWESIDIGKNPTETDFDEVLDKMVAEGFSDRGIDRERFYKIAAINHLLGGDKLRRVVPSENSDNTKRYSFASTKKPYFLATGEYDGVKCFVAECPYRDHATYIGIMKEDGDWEIILGGSYDEAKEYGARAVNHISQHETPHWERVIEAIKRMVDEEKKILHVPHIHDD
jgi:hypothetical protein